MTDPDSRLATVRNAIAKASKLAGRTADATTLIAVSKTKGAEEITALITAGQRNFGENRVQEAQARWTPLKARYPDVKLRLIGPLQSNKAREAVALFDAIDSVDRDKLAAALADEMARANKRLDVLIQINTGEEPQKAGVAHEADAFIARAREAHGLSVKGLMCIPPADEEPAMHFALLAKIATRNNLEELSMGMSGDYETAVRFGATMVRVGSALFGERG